MFNPYKQELNIGNEGTEMKVEILRTTDCVHCTHKHEKCCSCGSNKVIRKVVTMKKPQLSDLEKFGYYLAVFVTFGGYWFVKILIKKAIIEANNN